MIGENTGSELKTEINSKLPRKFSTNPVPAQILAECIMPLMTSYSVLYGSFKNLKMLNFSLFTIFNLFVSHSIHIIILSVNI